MTCEEARPLVHAYVDGELDLVRSLEVEAHVSGCTACARGHARRLTLHTAFSNGALYHQAPARLEQRGRAAVRDARCAERGRRGFALAHLRWAGATAAAVVLVAIFL